MDQEQLENQRLESMAQFATTRPANIILVGASGSGKTTIGKLLALYLGYGFVDSDELVAKSLGKPVENVFNEIGEEAFRKEEERQFEKLVDVKCHVIACGGGSLESDRSREIVNQLGVMIWLHPSSDELTRRLMSQEIYLKSRPLLSEVLEIKNISDRRKTLQMRMQVLTDQRASSYRKAQLEFDSNYSTPDLSAKALKSLLIENNLVSKDQVGKSFSSFLYN